MLHPLLNAAQFCSIFVIFVREKIISLKYETWLVKWMKYNVIESNVYIYISCFFPDWTHLKKNTFTKFIITLL